MLKEEEINESNNITKELISLINLNSIKNIIEIILEYEQQIEGR